jgi:GDP-L-fucose synthase
MRILRLSRKSNMEQSATIYVAGHQGLVGSAVARALATGGYSNQIVHTHTELDLVDSHAVRDFFATNRIEYVFLAAAKVGGIMGNKNHPADYIYQNLMIEANVIHEAYQSGVKKLLFLGSSCIYPRLAPQPIMEDALLSGPLEPTNRAYAVAKIAGIEMCQSYNVQYGTDFISVMPTNLYGPNDNFDLENSHVLPAMIRRFHEAKMANAPRVTLWGTGTPKREFLHVDDLARACVHLMQSYSGSEILNIGTGEDITIRELAELVQQVVGYSGSVVWDTIKPDGTPRKVLDVGRAHALGWTPRISLRDGIESTYEWFTQNVTV